MRRGDEPVADRQKKRKKATSVFTLNIGTFIFGVILLYIVISLIIYATTKHISTYQVISGPLAQNQTYTALAVRSETIVTANNDGYVRYYAQDGHRVSKSGAVYSLTQTVSETTGSTELSESALGNVRSLTAQFASSFNPANFGQVYSFKYALAGSILDYAGMDSSDSSTAVVGDASVYMAPESGIVAYSQDGMENISTDNFTADDFSYASYKVENLRTTEKITAGTPVYRLVKDETWSLIVPVSSVQATKLEGKTSIKVRFKKDSTTMTGSLQLFKRADAIYAEITFTSGVIRYVSDRYLEIELITNAEKGLKIPVTSIVSKNFFLVPKDFAVKDEDSSALGFIRRIDKKNGTSGTEFVNATIYASDDDNYYVDMTEFARGDILIRENSTQTFTLDKTGQLSGVYCINRGYTVFRRVEIIDQNEEYCIVKTGTSYGLALYDNIVLDSSTVREDEILF